MILSKIPNDPIKTYACANPARIELLNFYCIIQTLPLATCQGWYLPGFDDSDWEPVTVYTDEEVHIFK